MRINALYTHNKCSWCWINKWIKISATNPSWSMDRKKFMNMHTLLSKQFSSIFFSHYSLFAVHLRVRVSPAGGDVPYALSTFYTVL